MTNSLPRDIAGSTGASGGIAHAAVISVPLRGWLWRRAIIAIPFTAATSSRRTLSTGSRRTTSLVARLVARLQMTATTPRLGSERILTPRTPQARRNCGWRGRPLPCLLRPRRHPSMLVPPCTRIVQRITFAFTLRTRAGARRALRRISCPSTDACGRWLLATRLCFCFDACLCPHPWSALLRP